MQLLLDTNDFTNAPPAVRDWVLSRLNGAATVVTTQDPDPKVEVPDTVSLDAVREAVKKSSMASPAILKLMRDKYDAQRVSDIPDNQLADFIVDLGVTP